VLAHVVIRARDLHASEHFYRTVLAAIDVAPTLSSERLVGFDEFLIVGADPEHPPTSALHTGFVAPTREHVDAFWRAGIAAGYEDDGGPGERTLYGADYYGAFLRDPDGNSVEAVSTGRERRTGAIDHLWLRTRDVAAIRRFYVVTGHEFGVDEPDHVQIVTANASISYVAGEPLTEHVHIAFGVDTNEAVDAFHRAAVDAGYTDNGAPGERAAYHPGYYGAFVLDPDGHNIEAVNHNRS
jgi:catechol 2,3-dioxygenase-like lactoylglutathione lyase family enzyme